MLHSCFVSGAFFKIKGRLKMWNFKSLLGVIAISFLGVSLIGCKSERSQLIDNVTARNIKKMTIIYNSFTSSNKYKGPKDEAELKDWLSSEDCNKSTMERLNIDVEKIDDYLVSERTGEQFEIRWGVNSRPMGPPRPVIFETTAVDGIRQVGLAGGGILDVETDEEYDELMKGKYVAK